MYQLAPFGESFQALHHNKYLMRRRDVLARFYNSQAYYQSCADKLTEGENRRKMTEKLISPFTWKQLIFEILMIG